MQLQNESGFYSPHPPAAYTRSDVDGLRGPGVAFMENVGQWNLYWLSEPALDLFLTSAESLIDFAFLRSCIILGNRVDLQTGLPLQELAQQLPAPEVVRVVRRLPLNLLPPYELRGPLWLRAMEVRAGVQNIESIEGNVVYGRFPKTRH